ncbi:hypothetical protein Trydic_g22190 [Trypoxylus dichotomus]
MKNAVPSLFLPVPTVDGKENVSDHEHCTIVAESNAPTPEPNGVDRSTYNMSNKSKSGEAMVLESFCEAVTSVATSIDCCKISVRVTHGMVTDSSIILLKVLVPGPRDKHEINAKELTGFAEANLSVEDSILYEDLLNFLVETYSLDDIKNNLILAVNAEYREASETILLRRGDEIAVIPPISGG